MCATQYKREGNQRERDFAPHQAKRTDPKLQVRILLSKGHAFIFMLDGRIWFCIKRLKFLIVITRLFYKRFNCKGRELFWY